MATPKKNAKPLDNPDDELDQDGTEDTDSKMSADDDDDFDEPLDDLEYDNIEDFDDEEDDF